MKNITSTFFIFLLLTVNSTGYSQFSLNSIQKNSFYLEARTTDQTLGVGYFSLNYDRRFGRRKISIARIGLSKKFNHPIYGIPMTISWITNPKGKHHFEGGIGLMYRFEYYNETIHSDPFSMITLHYRFNSKRGLNLRSGINYYGYSKAIYYPVNLSFTLSLGYSF